MRAHCIDVGSGHTSPIVGPPRNHTGSFIASPFDTLCNLPKAVHLDFASTHTFRSPAEET